MKQQTTLETLMVAAVSAVAAAGLSYFYLSYSSDWPKRRQKEHDSSLCAYEELIGNTPMIELTQLSKLLKRRIFVKLEHLNPGGTGKDRAARSMILAAERAGTLPAAVDQLESTDAVDAATSACRDDDPSLSCNSWDLSDDTNKKAKLNGTSACVDEIMDAAIQKAHNHHPTTRRRRVGMVVEGTSGSTGIALATLAQSRGHVCVVVLPDDQALEKRLVLEALGAVVLVVPTHNISHPNHYVNMARRLAERARYKYSIQAVFMDQFDNLANFQVHFEETGPEVWEQCHQNVDAVCLSAGTGGTIAGVGLFLKQVCPSCRIVLVDPPGSSLYHKVVHGVCYAPQQAERALQRHRYDTLAEGIGLDRITHNLEAGLDSIDTAIQVSDQEALDMAHWLLRNEGLWVGSSSAMNVVGAVRTAMELPERSKIVTFICDSGQRHVTRFWNREFVLGRELVWPGDVSVEDRIPCCIRDAIEQQGG